jgi:predicted transcriptional regulator
VIESKICYTSVMSRPSTAKQIQKTDETAEFEKAVKQGIVSLDKGRGISYEKIRRWLLSWGTPNELSGR